MTTGEVVWVAGVFVAVLAITSVPALASLRGAGPRYRRAVWRQLVFGWAVAGLVGAWMVLGWYALAAGPRWMTPYRTATLVLMLASGPLLFLGIRYGVRSAARAQVADRAG
jgi:hypothetical protein